jgi:hypothetical protein
MLAAIAASYLIIEYPPLSVTLAHDDESVRQAEFYPLSSFPMYSAFTDRTYYVYVTDGGGEPLGFTTTFGTRAADVRKFYSARLRDTKEATGTDIGEMSPGDKREAGDAALRHLVEVLWRDRPGDPGFGALQLHEVVIEKAPGRVTSTEQLVGALTLEPEPTTAL